MALPGGDEAAALSFEAAVSITDAPHRCDAWRQQFEASAGWVGRDDVSVPDGSALLEFCRSFRFPETAVGDLVDCRASWDDPRIRRLGAHVQWLIARRYTPTGYRRLGWPPVFSRCPLFYAYAAIGLARRVAAEQSVRGVAAATTRATLWDIGQQVSLHHRVYGEVGMNKAWWLSHHLSHHLHRLGRLQFQRARSARGLGPIATDEPYLDVHIPEDGALDPAACSAAFEQAPSFFTRFWPQEVVRFYACSSWLLDPALEQLLPRDANILSFQRRFELHGLSEGPSGVFEFVFDRPDLDPVERPDVTGLPRDSRLRQALVDHYAKGGRIRMGRGTIRM